MAEFLRARADHIANLAKARSITLATVESCTAGTLAHLLSQTEGASELLHGGFIVYTKENKIASVGVSAKLLEEHTAVSAEVALAMARGGIDRCPAALVAAITGVAGPEPDEDGNPIGLVFVAAASRDGRSKVVRHEFGTLEKDRICGAAMGAALDLMEELLLAQVP